MEENHDSVLARVAASGYPREQILAISLAPCDSTPSVPVQALLRHLARVGAVRFQEPAMARPSHAGGSR